MIRNFLILIILFNMSNLFKNLKPIANPTKNGFDLSQRHTYTARAGYLYPVMCEDVVPGDYFEIDVAALSRTQPLVAPSFMRVRQFHHFFFVPYNSLWHSWDEFQTQRFDPIHAGQKPALYAPTVDLAMILHSWSADSPYGTSSTVWTNNVVPEVHDQARNIFDMLGYGDPSKVAYVGNSSWAGDSSYNPTSSPMRVNLFRAAAYQKIWNDYYRDHYHSQTLNPKIFNFDDIPCDSLANSYMENYRSLYDTGSGTFDGLVNFFFPRTRAWRKDLFTGSMPTPQFGDVSVVNTDSFKLFANKVNASNADTALFAYSSTSSNPDAAKRVGLRAYSSGSFGSFTHTDFSSPDLFNVLDLRKAEKLQEWKQKTLLAGNRIGDNYKAHYGVEPWRENDHANFIGGFDGLVTIDDVTSTTGHSTSGSTNELGQLAGKGIGSTSGSKIKYKVNDFGIIMCIVSFVPELEYDSCYLHKNNTLFEKFDWFTPEFENLGLEPVTRKELSLRVDNALISSNITPANYTAAANAVMGYAPRYYQYKTAVDRCHLELSSYGSLSYYSNPRLNIPLGTYSSGTFTGQIVKESDFYINPNVLDSVFGVSINYNLSTDQFVCVSSFDVKAIRPFSVLGIPSF